MRKRFFVRMAASAGLVGALAIGAIVMAPSTAAAAAAPCGLWGAERGIGVKGIFRINVYYYTIRNCHNYTVKRKLNVRGDLDGRCHTIRPNQEVRDTYGPYLSTSAIEGIKPC